ncbi:uncharacterized protein ACWYII_006834 isoform 1-T1 [Salvelinus alpinus]
MSRRMNCLKLAHLPRGCLSQDMRSRENLRKDNTVPLTRPATKDCGLSFSVADSAVPTCFKIATIVFVPKNAKAASMSFWRIWQYVQPASQPQTICNHANPGPPHLASLPAGLSETSHPNC